MPFHFLQPRRRGVGDRIRLGPAMLDLSGCGFLIEPLRKRRRAHSLFERLPQPSEQDKYRPKARESKKKTLRRLGVYLMAFQEGSHNMLRSSLTRIGGGIDAVCCQASKKRVRHRCRTSCILSTNGQRSVIRTFAFRNYLFQMENQNKKGREGKQLIFQSISLPFSGPTVDNWR
jgi:hypothetical protein